MNRSRSVPRVVSRIALQRTLALLLALAIVLPAAGCISEDGPIAFNIVTGSENRILFDDPGSDERTIMERFEKEENVDLVPSFQGSVDTMVDLQEGAEGYDAVWPASTIWLSLGDTQGVVDRVDSIMNTPVVFAVKRSKAEQLGWVGADVTVADILEAAESGDLRYMMSSATQSNSGAMAYLGYLYAFAGQPDALTSEMLQDESLVDQTRRLLGTVDRTAAASGFLRDFMVKWYEDYDGMVNNESAVISANQELVERGETDLLHVIYPVDGLALADWPLGYIDHEDERKSEVFDKLKAYLLSGDVQQQLLDQGRRTNPFVYPMNPETVDLDVFDPDWGIDYERVIDPFTIPALPVLLDALNLYQQSIRKPSFTVLCLDYSGSMGAGGEWELKEAMRVLLDQDQASRRFLQRTGSDVTIIIPFSGKVIDIWRVSGNDPAALAQLLEQIDAERPWGYTNIYDAMIAGLDEMESSIDGYAPAIILLTDGHSNQGSFEEFRARWLEGSPEGVPVFSILFGDASEEQLVQVSKLTKGDVHDGRDGLIDALRDSFANV